MPSRPLPGFFYSLAKISHGKAISRSLRPPEPQSIIVVRCENFTDQLKIARTVPLDASTLTLRGGADAGSGRRKWRQHVVGGFASLLDGLRQHRAIRANARSANSEIGGASRKSVLPISTRIQAIRHVDDCNLFRRRANFKPWLRAVRG